MKKRKAQALSLDLIMAIFVFTLILIGFFYIVTNMAQNKRIVQVKEENEYISRLFEENASAYSFIQGNRVLYPLLANLTGKNYTDLKTELGILNDFCIYFVDENNNLVKINNKTGIGSPRFFINNTPCGT